MPSSAKDTYDKLFQALKDKTEKDPYAEAGFVPVPYGCRSGVPQLDLCFQRDGLPFGRVIEIYGFEHCGKTTLAMQIAAQAQKMGGLVFWIDTEHTFLPMRAHAVGMSTEPPHFMGASCTTIESVIRTQETMIESIAKNGFDGPVVFVTDSITGVSTEFEVSHDFHKEQRVGHDAKQIRGGLRRLVPLLAKNEVMGIFINHAISGPASGPGFPVSDSAGGHALKFFSSARIEMANQGWEMKTVGGERVKDYQKVRLRVKKNKVADVEAHEVKTRITKNHGIDTVDNMLDAFVQLGVAYRPASASATAAGTTYTWKKGTEEERQFKRPEWAQLVENMGGVDVVYDKMLAQAVELGAIIPYEEIGD